MAAVALKNVSKLYDGNAAVRDLTLEIADGALVVLVGPSGCGKTTILRLIAGLERASAGEIHIGGRRVDGLEPRERNIAMVFQSYALYPHLSVYDNMALALRLRRLGKPEIERRVGEAAEMLGISHLLGRKPAQLSGGERQRVAMGRAIVRKPDVFLFDEPLSNLDAKLRTHMRGEIRRLHSRLATTAIYVTHDQAEAMTLGDEIVVLHRGRIMQKGAPLDVYRRPQNLFVAGFIGTPPANLLRARVEARGGRPRLLAPGIDLDWPAETAGAAEPWLGKELVVGIRPEHLAAATRGEAIEGTVDYCEPLGPQTLIHASVGGQELLALAAADPPAPGERVRFAVEKANLLLFDPASGERIGARH
jgi:multiple sugar transport system ATP-binding protein